MAAAGSIQENTSEILLERDTLVTVSGLQSEQGKKLNGGYGVILGEMVVDDAVRYPVLLFAVKKEAGDGDKMLFGNALIKNRIKVENLIVEPDPKKNKLFAKAAFENARKVRREVTLKRVCSGWRYTTSIGLMIIPRESRTQACYETFN